MVGIENMVPRMLCLELMRAMERHVLVVVTLARVDGRELQPMIRRQEERHHTR